MSKSPTISTPSAVLPHNIDALLDQARLTPGEGRRVCVGVSGGIDSAVTAYLLKQAGYQVQAMFMHNWPHQDDPHCPASDDLDHARRVCDYLDIELSVCDFQQNYRDRVFKRFLDDCAAGLTPNPDVSCNTEVKFHALLSQVSDDAEVATGHYARLNRGESGVVSLCHAVDATKDQSYFLCELDQKILRRVHFPLGYLLKKQVRELARRLQLPNCERAESMGICFVGERRYRDFLQEYLLAKPGEIIDLEGRVLGQHQGVIYYTYGQRQGLGIGGVQGASAEPWFVVDKDLQHNRLVVAQGQHPRLYRRTCFCRQIHGIGQPPASWPPVLSVRTRHLQALQCAQLVWHEQSMSWCVTFDQPQRAITPGQYAVFYEGECCLGGGMITELGPSEAER